MIDTSNKNLEEALEMSIYTWALAVFIGFAIFLIGNQFKSKTSKQNLYQISILLIAPFTLITGLMWVYYFTLVLCLPFYVLQLVLTWKLYRLKPSGKIVIVTFVLAGLTLLFSFLAAWFLAMF